MFLIFSFSLIQREKAVSATTASSSRCSHSQVAETETGREASRGAGGSGANAQAGAGGATRPANEGPARSLQRDSAIPIQRTAGVPLLKHPADPPSALRVAAYRVHVAVVNPVWKFT